MRMHAFSCALLLWGLAANAQTAAKPAYESDPNFIRQRDEAVQIERRRGNELFAAEAWHSANKTAHGKCMPCYAHAIRDFSAAGEMKSAQREAIAMEAVADTPVDKSEAEFQQGKILLYSTDSEKPKAAVLEQAHAALAKACETDPKNRNAAFLDGMALARLGRNAEAGTAFRSYAALSNAADPIFLRAEHFAENPELARHRMAPPVVVTTLNGRRFNLDDMHGRVVLIDFWATWCGPCNVELPHMQKLAKKYANEPFELVSVSWDSDAAKWKDFIAAHGMTWNQYLDSNHALSKAFNVNEIPHYFTIDADGVLTAENVDSGSLADSRIDKLVQRARDAQRQRLALGIGSAGAAGGD